MGIIISVIIGVIVGYIVYLIMGLVPFLEPFATIGGLTAFLLVVFGGYSNGWQFPNRRV